MALHSLSTEWSGDGETGSSQLSVDCFVVFRRNLRNRINGAKLDAVTGVVHKPQVCTIEFGQSLESYQ